MDKDVLLALINIVTLVVVGVFQILNKRVVKDTNQIVKSTETKLDNVHEATNGKLAEVERKLKEAIDEKEILQVQLASRRRTDA